MFVVSLSFGSHYHVTTIAHHIAVHHTSAHRGRLLCVLLSIHRATAEGPSGGAMLLVIDLSFVLLRFFFIIIILFCVCVCVCVCFLIANFRLLSLVLLANNYTRI